MPADIRSRWRFALIPLTALLVIVPFWFAGTSCGHDLSFHVQSWLETTTQWHQGVLYPRWAMQADYGNGEPRFIFYPPISWLIGALLGLALPWQAAPAVFVLFCCTLSGLTLYLFARHWLERRTAFFAAIFYVANAYQLMVVYERSAFAELLAAALLPLAMLCILREGTHWLRNALLLALPLAAIWLTNAPSGVIATYLVVFLAVLRSIHLREGEPLLRVTIGLGLAFGLAAFYLVPAAYEQKWVIISQAISPGLRPQDNFLFTKIGDADHDSVLRGISYFCLLEFALMIPVLWLARTLRKGHPFLYWTLAAIAALCAFLTLPASNFLWHLPKLAYVQFPSRWLMVLNVAFAVLAAASLARLRLGGWLLCLIVPGTIAAGYLHFRQHCYPEDTVQSIVKEFNSPLGYVGTDEYCPATGDNYNVDDENQIPELTTEPDLPDEDSSANGQSSPPIHSAIQRWEPEYRSFIVDSPVPTSNTLRLMNYPAWKADIDGRPISIETQEDIGRIVLRLPAGHHVVTLRFTRTADRFWGGVISIVCLTITAILWLAARNK